MVEKKDSKRESCSHAPPLVFLKIIDYFSPVIVTSTTYWPFGLPLETGEQPQEYRFGFQGQACPELSRREKDNEWTGTEGSHLAFKYRIHDARIGRFLSVDPLTRDYPHNSPYAFSENRVINSGELEGLEAVVRIYQQRSKTAIRTIDYTQTKQVFGPLGNGTLIIRKWDEGKTTLHYSDPNDPDQSFMKTIDSNDFVEPPDEIYDGPRYVFTSKAKIGMYGEAGLSIGNVKLKLAGGAYQEFLCSDSEGNKEFLGDLKGNLGLGPLNFEANTKDNTISLEGSLSKFKSVYTHDFDTGDGQFTSTITGEEDIDVFGLSYGTFLGASFNLRKINPLKYARTTKWHSFLNEVNPNNKVKLPEVPEGAIHK
ncbi:MAG: hypothetical protein PF692_09340 [Kiritimatiellae bacterium]|nr:hypothetical protein [Kiritimatiellia bacterium]